MSILTLLASARRGLSDRELLDLIEETGLAIESSTSDLFPILRQLRSYLQHRGELWDFFHRNLYKAVHADYLRDEERQSAAHARLASYFNEQDYFMESLEEQRARAKRLPPTPRPANIRKVDELPWQLLQVAKLSGKDDPKSPHWDAIADLFTDLHFLEAKAEAQPYARPEDAASDQSTTAATNTMIFDLVKDFADVLDAMPAEHPRHRILKLLDEAIRRDVHFIDRHPTTFFQCMWNTCWWYDCPEAAGHYEEPKGNWAVENPPWERLVPNCASCLRLGSMSGLNKHQDSRGCDPSVRRGSDWGLACRLYCGGIHVW